MGTRYLVSERSYCNASVWKVKGVICHPDGREGSRFFTTFRMTGRASSSLSASSVGWKFALLHVSAVAPQGLRLLYAAPIDLIDIGRVRVELRARHEGDKVPVSRDHRCAPPAIRR